MKRRRSRSLAPVAEHHRLHVDRGAEVLGDLLLAAVEHARSVFQESKTARDREVELLARVLREVAAGRARSTSSL